VEGIEVVEVSERNTSKTCCVCGKEDKSQRVERGLYVCEDHGDAFNTDVNGAENLRTAESNSEFSASLDGDRCAG
jgi:putative transposase